MARREKHRLVVAITGATGSVYGIRLLQVLQGSDVETHLVISGWGARTLLHETPYTLEQVRGMATRAYSENDQGAALSSGSFLTAGMVVAPCSMRTLSAIAHGQAENLVHRVDDIVNHTVQRVLDLFDVHLDVAERWTGMKPRPVARLARSRGRS